MGMTPQVQGALSLRNVTRRFGAKTAVSDVSLDVAPGELLALVGASGSGKTTTLRIAAGYEHPDSGAVYLGDTDITMLPPQHRGFGMVFQHYALFPHMSVEDNVAFGLAARGVRKAERLARAREALAGIGLEGAGARAIQSLSGGEQQRVAVARALVIEPSALLLDEPLSNVDPTLRQTMRDDLSALLHRANVPALLVTHDQEDAFAVADRIAVLRDGHLLQVGTPEDLYDAPASTEVARFIGRGTVLPCVVNGDRVTVSIAGLGLDMPRLGRGDPKSGGTSHAVLRTEGLALSRAGTDAAWPGIVRARRFTGSAIVYRVQLADDVTVDVTGSGEPAHIGDEARVRPSGRPVPVVTG